MISKNKIFIFFIFSFLSGIFINNVINDFFSSALLLVTFSFGLLNTYLYTQKNKVYSIFIVLGFLFGVFISTYNFIVINNNNKIISYDFSNKRDILAEIKNINKIKETEIEYVAQLININNLNTEDNSIYFLVNIPINYKLKEGYRISFDSKLYEINNMNNFKYKEYLLTKGIYFKSYASFIQITSTNNISKIKSSINQLRAVLLLSIKKIYTKEESSFLGGVLFGAREELPEKLKKNFNNSGLTHIIAVSGFNITILIIFFSFLFKYIPLLLRTILIIAVIIIFILFVGFTAPVIRAGIMGIIGYIILTSGRQNNVLSTMLLTAFIMVIVSPLTLNYDVSFHLSFLSVIGIVYSQDFFKKVFSFLPNFLAIKEAFILTLSALFFTLPIIIFNFGQVSILSPITNVLVIWTIPIAMLLGFISIVLYFLYPFFGIIVGYFNWILLKYDIIVVNFFGELKYSTIKIDFGSYGIYIEILYFLLLIFFILFFNKEEIN